MNTTTNKIIGVVAALALIIGVVAYNKTPKTIVGSSGSQGPKGEQGVAGPQGPQGDRGPIGPAGASAPRILGSATGPEISSPYITVGGLTTYYGRQTLRPATTTPCALQGPASTSTLEIAQFQVTTGTSTATTWTIAQATTAFATTTSVGSFTVASGAQVSTSTIPSTLPGFVVSPNAYIVFGLAGIGGNSIPGSAVAGTCSAEFIVQ